MEHKPSHDEIDLLEVLSKVCHILFKNKLTIIGCLLIGLIGTYTYYKLTEKSKYTGNMMISTTLLSQEECQFIMGDLENPRSFESIDTARVISKITSVITLERETNYLYLRLTVEAYSIYLFPALQSSIIKYLNDQQPVLEKRKNQEFHCVQMIKKIDEEIESSEKSRSSIANSNSSDYRKILDLQEKKLFYQESLKDVQTVHLVKGFEPTRINKNVMQQVLGFGLAIGFCLSMAILFFRFFIPKYRGYLNNQI